MARRRARASREHSVRPSSPGQTGRQRPRAEPAAHPVLELQRTAGNAAVGELIDSARPGSPAQLVVLRQTDPPAAGAGTATAPAAGWRDSGNLRGAVPVRSDHPPDINIVEDEGEYSSLVASAHEAQARQTARAQALLDPRGEVQDYRYFFAKVYSYVTQNMIKFCEGHAFFYPSWVLRCVLYFEQLFNDAFDAYSSGAKVEDHWKQAFDRMAGDKQMVDDAAEMMLHPAVGAEDGGGGAAINFLMQEMLKSTDALVAGMQAHIRFDLPRAEAWVFNSFYAGTSGATQQDFTTDFMSMGGVFDKAGQEMVTDMAARLGLPLSYLPTLMQDQSMRYLFSADMATERADTFRRSEELIAGGAAGTGPYQVQDGRLTGSANAGDYLSMLSTLPPADRPSMDRPRAQPSHDEVLAEISALSDSDIAGRSLMERVQWMRALMYGYTGSEAAQGILRILRASTGSDFTTLVDGTDAWDLMHTLDGSDAQALRNLLNERYYQSTAPQTALKLIIKCVGGRYTFDWEEYMITDIMALRSGELREIVTEIGRAFPGPVDDSDPDKVLKDGLYKLEWRLVGSTETRMRELMRAAGLPSESGYGWWHF